MHEFCFSFNTLPPSIGIPALLNVSIILSTPTERLAQSNRAFQRDPSLGSAHALNDNYRSCKEVIDFVNTVFDNIMTRDLGGIDYRRESRLTQGNKDYLPQEGKAVRIAHFAKEAVELDIKYSA